MDAGRLEHWWRIEFNQAGNVSSCETVEVAERNTRTVMYFRAVCREHAIAAAERWIQQRRRKQAAYEQRRRVERKRKGLCIACTNKRAKHSLEFCEAHLKKKREYQRERSQAKNAGTWVPQQPGPGADPVAAMARDAARHERYRRMGVQLNIVLAVFDQVDGRIASPFRQWLVDEIAQRGGNAQAAQ